MEVITHLNAIKRMVMDNIKIESSLDGSWTNGNNTLDKSSLWYSTIIILQNESDVEISGGFKLTGSPSLGNFYNHQS